MKFKHIASSCIAAAMIITPMESSAGDGLVGGIIGGIIGGAIVNGANQHRYRKAAPRRSTKKSYSGVSTSQRNETREVQVALNYFGFPVGTPDGALGPKSRAAISQYQAMLGFAPSGNLNSWEQELLIQSYYRAQAGGALTAQQVASDPRGTKGLLFAYRDEKLGVAAPGGQMAAAAPQPAAPQAGFAAAGTSAVAAAVPQFGASAAGTALPSFMGQGAAQTSLASHCNKVSLVTNSNGGFVTQVTMKDPAFALSEQFCLARTYAIAQSEELVAKVAGFTPQQITQQCEGFGPVMKDHVAGLSLKSRDEVLKDVSAFVLTSGMAPAQLAGTAKICLGVGYVTDNMDVAIGSALILTTLGDAPYAELLGHHLASGIGTAQRSDLSLPWFDEGFDATSNGAAQVFAPGMVDRPALVRLAAYSSAGRSLPGATVPGAPVPASALPSFAVPGAVANP
ncbi:peptidoglycan-binding domain-containing protein [Pseudorhodobacter sp.]|uniref:peptidoglycan-binding domain-containing protein n=1 Tax=Pseudorhodobacter sp. TaxID=1934400 RepID=UPI002649B488|nr:peptidoglycan-binding domain-containing protein [Pseudorhodobacter sp.]MDN5786848.1 peptidoglycan-binding protein [Pseudorhodobacter sp.]